MKLKKVVSLALAGVMAVSMLAGCGTSGKQEPTEDENDATQVGYSAEFAKIADLDLDYVAFQDSTVDQEALKAAVASCTDVQLYAAFVGGNVNGGINGRGINGQGHFLDGAMWAYNVADTLDLPCVSKFTEKADLDEYAVNSTLGFSSLEWYFGSNGPGAIKEQEINQPMKAGAIAVVDGTMDTETVLARVNKLLHGALDKLPEGNTTGTTKYDYSYTVSVSLVNRVATSTDLLKADMDFVAVTVSRTATPHQA